MDNKPVEEHLPLPGIKNISPKTALGKWLLSGESAEDAAAGHHKTEPWYRVLWLTGVDYFSTLGYQPGIALLAAGALSPIATIILVLVTLFGALPIYSQVSRRSFAGQGSIAMLETLFTGWRSKIFVLILLGFAATDFVITMTLSAADAAHHAVENPYLQPYLGHAHVTLTCFFLVALALVFLKGFKEAIRLAIIVGLPYIGLNVIVMIRAIFEISRQPELLSQWRTNLTAIHGDWTMLIIASSLVFPRLALGLSGFETGVSVMPLVEGSPKDSETQAPEGRIKATHKLLTSAALIMSVLLIASSFVTTLLIPEEAYKMGGPAAGRAIAFLAHSLLGEFFGTVYDVSTMAILWFAGASAMAGLLNLIPRYLPRFGMSPQWISYRRPLVLTLLGINLFITFIFDASVEAQGAAYATGVLALMLSASFAVTLTLWNESKARPFDKTKWMAVYFGLVTAAFTFTFIDNVITRPDGVVIAFGFIAAIVVFSAASRWRRATELRVTECSFIDAQSLETFKSLMGKKVHLLPLRTATRQERERKTAELKKYYKITGSIAFIHVSLRNNRSEFLTDLQIQVTPEEGNFVIEVHRAVAIANTIAYVSEVIDPKSIFIGLTRENLMTQALRYLFWGEGETGLMVYTILLRYWEATPEEDVRPLIFLMSD
jgi:hypothetical protein